jgi:hypothetical protein
MPTGAFLLEEQACYWERNKPFVKGYYYFITHAHDFKAFFESFLFFLKNFFNDSSNAER